MVDLKDLEKGLYDVFGEAVNAGNKLVGLASSYKKKGEKFAKLGDFLEKYIGIGGAVGKILESYSQKVQKQKGNTSPDMAFELLSQYVVLEDARSKLEDSIKSVGLYGKIKNYKSKITETLEQLKMTALYLYNKYKDEIKQSMQEENRINSMGLKEAEMIFAKK